jgi:hypothetical protein
VFETQMEYYEKEFFPWCLKNNVKYVLSLGDIVHNRNVIDLWILQELKQRFFKWFDDNNIQLHILIGNHCTYYKSSLETNFLAENVNEFTNTIVYSDPTIIKINKYTIAMMPWIIDEKQIKFPEAVDIVCGHFDVKNMLMVKGIYSSDGLDASIFKKYKYVFSGHYHIKSQKDNLHYVGTQYQLSWSDYNEEKGFYVLEDDYKLKFIENKCTPKFLKLYYTSSIEDGVKLKVAGYKKKVVEVTKDEAIALGKNNYFKLITDKITNQHELDLFYASLMNVTKNDYKIEIINSNEIIETFDFDEIEESISVDANTHDLIKDCLQSITFEKNILKEDILSLFDELYKEALEFKSME